MSGPVSFAAYARSPQSLESYLTPDKDPSHVEGLSDPFRNSLLQLFGNLPQEMADGLRIYSGYRSPDHQSRLWQQALKKYGSPEAARKWVAPPGRSYHNKGLAADLRYASDAVRDWAHKNAAQYGLHFPLAHEPWHIELAGSRSGPSPQPAPESRGTPRTPPGTPRTPPVRKNLATAMQPPSRAKADESSWRDVLPNWPATVDRPQTISSGQPSAPSGGEGSLYSDKILPMLRNALSGSSRVKFDDPVQRWLPANISWPRR